MEMIFAASAAGARVGAARQHSPAPVGITAEFFEPQGLRPAPVSIVLGLGSAADLGSGRYLPRLRINAEAF
jgi:hypothetical protein